MGRKKGIPGISFSWKRATGISQAQSKISRKIGIPLSKAGRQRKAGAAMGCCFPAIIIAATILAFGFGAARLAFAQEPACDWSITTKTDQMTDVNRCFIHSESAKITIVADKERVMFLTGSAYRNDALQIRVDENPAIYLGEIHSTSEFKDKARIAVRQIMEGSRLRTQFRDYPAGANGDAPICNLPELIRNCGAPMEQILNTKSQLEMIRELSR